MFNRIAYNKKGWIKVVEAFLAVLLIGGVLILVLNQKAAGGDEDIPTKVYSDEKAMLRAVELDGASRASILAISDSSLPISISDAAFPQSVKTRLEQKNPGYLDCDAKICVMEQECVIINDISAEVYSTYTVIFANYQTYNPRKVVLSCTIIE